MIRFTRTLCISTAVLTTYACAAFGQQNGAPKVILNARVADGTGQPLRKANVRIIGDLLVDVGNFQPRKEEQVIDAKGLVLAPGFIDIHNHSTEGLQNRLLAESQIAQGITTIVLGADGESPWPVAPWLEERQKNLAALNMALLVGHATVREQVMGKDFKRAATPAEIEKMSRLVDEAMRDGALGLSRGLEYEVGSYSTRSWPTGTT